jgi:hypothetical protein
LRLPASLRARSKLECKELTPVVTRIALVKWDIAGAASAIRMDATATTTINSINVKPPEPEITRIAMSASR